MDPTNLGFLTQFLQGSGDIAGIDEGTNLIVGGYNMAAQADIAGGNLSANAFLQGGAAALATANYNAQLTKINAGRQQSAFTQQIQSLFSHNQAIGAANGVSMNSGSYLATVNQNMSDSETKFLQMKNSEQAQIDQQLYEGQVANVMYQNRAADAQYSAQVQAMEQQYKGQIAQYQGDNKMIPDINGLVDTGFSWLMS